MGAENAAALNRGQYMGYKKQVRIRAFIYVLWTVIMIAVMIIISLLVGGSTDEDAPPAESYVSETTAQEGT